MVLISIISQAQLKSGERALIGVKDFGYSFDNDEIVKSRLIVLFFNNEG